MLGGVCQLVTDVSEVRSASVVRVRQSTKTCY